MAACDRHGSRIRKQEAHTVDCKHGADRVNLKWQEGFSSKAHQLGSKCSNMGVYGGHSCSNHDGAQPWSMKSQSPKLLGLTVEEGPFPTKIQGR